MLSIVIWYLRYFLYNILHNVETTSINVRRLNFHFQPNINVDVFAGLCLVQKQPPVVLYKKAVLKNFAIFAGNYLC